MESAARNDILHTSFPLFPDVSQENACGNARGVEVMMLTGLVSMMFVGDRRVSGGLGGPVALTNSRSSAVGLK